MIPTSKGAFVAKISIPSSRTYRMDPDNRTISGRIDEKEAVRQAVYKILSTQRYEELIYSWRYGTELLHLYGKGKSFVVPELERVITEALLCDDRIKKVEQFACRFSKSGIVTVSFHVLTVYGEIKVQREVEV